MVRSCDSIPLGYMLRSRCVVASQMLIPSVLVVVRSVELESARIFVGMCGDFCGNILGCLCCGMSIERW